MTNTTKIVLGVATALILALLGGYLWIEYGGSPDDSARGLTVEEQSPIVHARGAADRTDSSAETETAGGIEAAQTPETPSTGNSGETVDANAASAGEAVSADAPDAFSTEFQEAVEELNDFAKKLQAEFPEFSGVTKMAVEMGDALLKREAELRQQGMTAEERKTQLREQYQTASKSFSDSFMDPMVKGTIHDPLESSDPVATFRQHADKLRALIRFMAENQPKKMETVLGLPTSDVSMDDLDEIDAVFSDLDSFIIDASMPAVEPEDR